jgi:hypothetical protein
MTDATTTNSSMALADPKFTARLMELDRRTAKRPLQRFSATAVPVDVLARLGSLLTEIANIKKSGTVNPASSMGNATDEPVATEPEHTALEASVEEAA